MMNITVNGKSEKLKSQMNIWEFLVSKGIDPDTVVVEHNYDIVKTEQWKGIALKENDNLEVLKFVGGG